MTEEESGFKGHDIEVNISEVYSDYFRIGAALASGEYGFNALTAYPPEILSVFNSFTAENSMKPGVIQPREGSFNWRYADSIMELAERNNAVVRGHALVWHQQTPAWMWMGTREEAQAKMKAHIDAVVGRYKGRIYAWDVVNEAVSDSGGYRTNSGWYMAYEGPQYIQDAFDFAHAADPDARLFYNDYNVVNHGKRQSIINMINELNLIENHNLHGIGIQGHWQLNWPSIIDIQITIDIFHDMGLDIHITELDIDVYGSGSRPEEPYSQQIDDRLAARYQSLFSLFRKNADKISNVTLWGVADDHTWLNHFWDGRYHSHLFRQNYPMLFTTDHRAKGAYLRITDF